MQRVKQLLFIFLLQPVLVFSQSYNLDTGQSDCYNLEEQIPCGSTEFPRQDADFNPKFEIKDRWRKQAPGIINDGLTRLDWTQCSLGGNESSCDSPKTMDWKTAKAECERLQLNHHPWRLPTITELNTLINIEQTPIKINLFWFPKTLAAPYWAENVSLTRKTKTNQRAWFVHFGDGSIFDADTTKSHFVRCVSTERNP